MKPARAFSLALIVLLAACYGYRAAAGVYSGIALVRGRLLAYASKDELAIPQFAKAAVGFDRVRALRDAADARLRLWSEQLRSKGLAQTDPRLLSDAAGAYLECLCLSPASWWPWEGLAQVYYRIEEAPIEVGAAPVPSSAEPWAGVGRAGRVAVGLLRLAIERTPNWYANYDSLAMRLGRYGLEEQALDVVRQSALVLPLFGPHDYRLMPELPPPVLDAFAEGAWQAQKGPASILTRWDLLIDVAKVEWRRGNLERAIEALTEALQADADELNLAEANFVMGSVLRAARRYDEARPYLDKAARHPEMEAAALTSLAAMAQENGRQEEALRVIQRLRWKDPQNLDYCLQYAEIARKVGNWPAAEEALKWAAINHRGNPRPRVALFETYLEMGEITQASRLLHELELEALEGVDLEPLRQALQSRSEDRRSHAELDQAEP